MIILVQHHYNLLSISKLLTALNIQQYYIVAQYLLRLSSTEV